MPLKTSEVWRVAFFHNPAYFYFDVISEIPYNTCLGYTRCFGLIEDLSYR